MTRAALNQVREYYARRCAELSDTLGWLDLDTRCGHGELGVVVINTSARYREPVVRDFATLWTPAWVSIYGAHAIAYRFTGTPVSWVHDGLVSMSGAAAKLDRSSHGPGAPAATVVETPGGFTVECRSCARLHMAAAQTSLDAWAPYVLCFGGEVFLCPCGAESELIVGRA